MIWKWKIYVKKDDEIFNDIYADIDEMSDEEVELDYYSSSDENGDDEHESDSLLETEPDFQLESESIRDKLRYDRLSQIVELGLNVVQILNRNFRAWAYFGANFKPKFWSLALLQCKS